MDEVEVPASEQCDGGKEEKGVGTISRKDFNDETKIWKDEEIET